VKVLWPAPTIDSAGEQPRPHRASLCSATLTGVQRHHCSQQLHRPRCELFRRPPDHRNDGPAVRLAVWFSRLLPNPSVFGQNRLGWDRRGAGFAFHQLAHKNLQLSVFTRLGTLPPRLDGPPASSITNRRDRRWGRCHAQTRSATIAGRNQPCSSSRDEDLWRFLPLMVRSSISCTSSASAGLRAFR